MTQDILFEEREGTGGDLGVVTLNRPSMLNALTHAMCLDLTEKLNEWAEAPHIKAVFIQGEGDKAFSAGGDVVQLYQLGRRGDYGAMSDFFRDEYRLNHQIHNYKKPFIAFMDGVTMGGGVGVSIHGSHSIATERFKFCMPETSIGFFPDIGGSYFLSRCQGEMGLYLGLTGRALNAAEALYIELTDHLIASNHLNEIITMLLDNDFGEQPYERVSAILNKFSVKPEMQRLVVEQEHINNCFGKDTFEEIIATLEVGDKEWHRETLATLHQKSPTSLKITLREIREGIALDFSGCMKMEYRLCQRFIHDPDFYEGVRAALIDKDKQPVWEPASIAAVSGDVIERYFAPLSEELVLAKS